MDSSPTTRAQLWAARLAFRIFLRLRPYLSWIRRPFGAAPRQFCLIHVVHHSVEMLLRLRFIARFRNEWSKSVDDIAYPGEAELTAFQTAVLPPHAHPPPPHSL